MRAHMLSIGIIVFLFVLVGQAIGSGMGGSGNATGIGGNYFRRADSFSGTEPFSTFKSKSGTNGIFFASSNELGVSSPSSPSTKSPTHTRRHVRQGEDLVGEWNGPLSGIPGWWDPPFPFPPFFPGLIGGQGSASPSRIPLPHPSSHPPGKSPEYQGAPSEVADNYENVDMLAGSLFFATTDFYLPGRNGMDLEIKRVYNSNVTIFAADANCNGPDTEYPTRQEYLGYGWHLNFSSRIQGDTMIYPNGATETLFRDLTDTSRLKNRSFEIIKRGATNGDPDTLFRLDGTRVIYGNYRDYYMIGDGTQQNAYGGKRIIKIVDAQNNATNIYYKAQVPLIDSIVDPGGRKVWFEYEGYEDTSYLEYARLISLNYKNGDGNTRTIHYEYGDGSWFYPLTQVTYPSGETFEYEYTDTASYNNGSVLLYGIRLRKVTLPNGGQYVYNWRVYRETNSVNDSCYYHAAVNTIQKINTDGTIDTIQFSHDYSTNPFSSSITFPDGSGRVYWHKRNYSDPASHGLLDRIFYRNKISGAADSACALRWGVNNSYTSSVIGTEIQSPHSSVSIPILTHYEMLHEGFNFSGGVSDTINNSSFNVYTGNFGSTSDASGTHIITEVYRSAINRAIQAADYEISKSGSATDTVITSYYWNSDTTLIDSVKVTSKGVTRKSSYSYDSYGNKIRERRPLGDSLCWEYSDSVQGCYPTKMFNQYGNLWKAGYYLNSGKIKYMVNSNDDATQYRYDSYDRFSRVILPLESDTSQFRRYVYDSSGLLITDSIKIDNGQFQKKISYYDGFNRLAKTRLIDNDLDSIITKTEFDFRDRVKRDRRPYTSDTDTAWTRLNYDIIGRVVRKINPDGTKDSVYYAYESSPSLVLKSIQIDPLDRKVSKLYNIKQELLKVVSDTSSSYDTLKYDYATYSRVAGVTDPRGLLTKYWYDGFGNAIKDSSGDEEAKSYYYDSRNRLRFIRYPNPITPKWSYRKYDNSGRLIESGTADTIVVANVDDMGYPSSGQTTQVTYKYDNYSTGFAPPDTSYKNNPKMQLTETDDESGRVWLYYDARGRLVHKRIKYDGLSDTLNLYYAYNKADQIETLTYPDSTNAYFNYFNSLRISDYSVDDGQAGYGMAAFKYKPWGGTEKIIYANDTSFTTTNTYDIMSMPTKMFTRKSGTKRWGRAYYYNDAHMIDTTRQVNDSGTPTDVSTTYGYNYLYRLTSANLYDPNPDRLMQYTYDRSGNRDTINEDGVWVKYYYLSVYDTLRVGAYCDDIGNESDSLSFTPITNDTIYWQCDFEVAGHGSFRIWSSTHTYVSVSSSGSGSFVPQSLDPIYVKAECIQLHQGVTGSVIYYGRTANSNKLGRISGQNPSTYSYNANGCLTSDLGKDLNYFFDESNRLDSVQINENLRYAFSYDYAGRRVKKTIYRGVGSYCDQMLDWDDVSSNDYCDRNTSDSSVCHFVPGDINGSGACNGIDVTYFTTYLQGGAAPPYPFFRADCNCSHSVNGIDNTYLINYIRGGAAPKCCWWLKTDTTVVYYVYSGDQLIAEYDESGNVLDKYVYVRGQLVGKFNSSAGRRHYITDIRGSVAAVLPYDGSSVTTSYEYYPFGQILSVTAADDRYKFITKELEDIYDWDQYYFGARYYDATVGRFISPDPVRWYYNPYGYCGNDPIMFLDLWGFDRSTWVQRGALVGGIIGGGLAEMYGAYLTTQGVSGFALGASKASIAGAGAMAGGFLGGALYDGAHSNTVYNDYGGAPCINCP